MATYRYIPDWIRGKQEASRRAWETRWENLWREGRESELGPKGRAYIEAKYGPEIEDVWEYEDDWPDVGEIEHEEDDTPEE